MDVLSDNTSLQFVVAVSPGRGERYRKSNKQISTAGKGTFPIFIPGAGSVARKLFSADLWLRNIEIYTFL